MQSDLTRWFESASGQHLLQQESDRWRPQLVKSLADVCLQVGGCRSSIFIDACSARWTYCLGDFIRQDVNMACIAGDLKHLPIKPGTIDAIILPHTFDMFMPTKDFLSQLCQLLTPGGDLFVIYFNPYSLCHQAIRCGFSPAGLPPLMSHKPARWRHQLKSLGLVSLFEDTLPCFWPGLEDDSWLKYLLDKGAWSSLGCTRMAHWRKSQWSCQWVGREPLKSTLRPASVMGSVHRLARVFEKRWYEAD